MSLNLYKKLCCKKRTKISGLRKLCKSISNWECNKLFRKERNWCSFLEEGENREIFKIQQQSKSGKQFFLMKKLRTLL